MFDDEFIIPFDETKLIDESLANIPSDLDSYPVELRDIALAKFELVIFIRRELKAGWTEANLSPLIEQYFADKNCEGKPSWRTLVRWHKVLELNCDDPSSLIDKHKSKGSRINKKNDNEFFIYAVNIYLNAKRPSVISAYISYKDQIVLAQECGDYDGKAISQRAFYKRLDQWNSYELVLKRHGKFQADMKFGYKGATIKPERVMQRVEIDHTALDIILLDDKTNTPIGRPYLTLLKDVYSKCIVGYHLTFKAPCYVSVAKAICHTMMPKQKAKDKWGIDWQCYGKIEVLVVDNGAEFWSKSLEQFCYELKINIQYNPVRKPWLKPFIERNFRSINDLLLDNLPGKTFRSSDERGEYNSVSEAKVKFSDFIHAFELWIAKDFNCSPNSRKTQIPLLAWQRGVEKSPPAILAASVVLKLPVLSGLKITPTLQSSGFQFKYLRYDSEKLAEYRKEYLRGKKTKEMLVKVNVDDLSNIYVYLPELKLYLPVPCVEKEYTKGLSFDQHMINLSYLRMEIKLNGESDLTLAKVREEIRVILFENEISSSKKSKNLKAAKKVAQYRGDSSETVRNSIEESLVVDSDGSTIDKEDGSVTDLEKMWRLL